MKGLRVSLLLLVAAIAVACSESQVGSPAANPVAPSATSNASRSATGSGRFTYIPVTTAISDVDSNGIAADIASDGQGPYADTCSSPSGNACGGTGVASWLTSNGYNGIQYGDWQFDTYSSPARKVSHSFDHDDAVLAGDPNYQAPAAPQFWGAELLQSHIEVKCTLLSKSMLKMNAGTSITCPMVNRFNVAGTDDDLGLASSFPETTDMQIDCNAVDATGCKDWNLHSLGTSPGIARLVYASTGKKPTTIDGGDFYLRFLIHVTRP